VKASVDGRLVPIPINLDTINELYGTAYDSEGMKSFLASVAEHRDPLVTSEDVVVNGMGRELYEKFFRGYTRKQWGLDPSELDAQVTARIPVRFNRDARYFTDSYQAMPAQGYTEMFRKMLAHPNIKIMLNTDYREIRDEIGYGQLIFTGPVDEYFDHRFGRLPYRSLEFKHETHHQEKFQEAPVVNYPNDYEYTRITEFKYLTGQYQQLADSLPDVHFVGRLATYKYYNMDQVVAQALTLFSKISGSKRAQAMALTVPSR
jgi:UDP-galactopyranose mutase